MIKKIIFLKNIPEIRKKIKTDGCLDNKIWVFSEMLKLFKKNFTINSTGKDKIWNPNP